MISWKAALKSRFIGKQRRCFITCFNTEAERWGVQQVLALISGGCLIHYQWVCLQTMLACNNICDGSWSKGVHAFSGWPNALRLIFPPPPPYLLSFLSHFVFLSFFSWIDARFTTDPLTTTCLGCSGLHRSCKHKFVLFKKCSVPVHWIERPSLPNNRTCK